VPATGNMYGSQEPTTTVVLSSAAVLHVQTSLIDH
jgi:hypothetical protein